MSRPNTMPLSMDQQVLFNALSVPMMGGVAAIWKQHTERVKWERQQKENNIMTEITNTRTKADGTLAQIAGINQKITDLVNKINAIDLVVKEDNQNYEKVLSHTKSVLATVQNTTRDLCTDTDFLRHEMEKIHSTIRVVPGMYSDFKKVEIRLDIAENDIIEIKNPPVKKTYNWEIFIISVFVAFLSWFFMVSRQKSVLALDY